MQAAALDTAGELPRQQLLHALSILKHMALGCPAAGRALAQGDVMDVLRRCVVLARAWMVSSRGHLSAVREGMLFTWPFKLAKDFSLH